MSSAKLNYFLKASPANTIILGPRFQQRILTEELGGHADIKPITVEKEQVFFTVEFQLIKVEG